MSELHDHLLITAGFLDLEQSGKVHDPGDPPSKDSFILHFHGSIVPKKDEFEDKDTDVVLGVMLCNRQTIFDAAIVCFVELTPEERLRMLETARKAAGL